MNKENKNIQYLDIVPLEVDEQHQIKGGCGCGDIRQPRPGSGTTSLVQVPTSGKGETNFFSCLWN